MHDGMQCDLIEGKGQGHEPFKVGNPATFNSRESSKPNLFPRGLILLDVFQ